MEIFIAAASPDVIPPMSDVFSDVMVEFSDVLMQTFSMLFPWILFPVGFMIVHSTVRRILYGYNSYPPVATEKKKEELSPVIPKALATKVTLDKWETWAEQLNANEKHILQRIHILSNTLDKADNLTTEDKYNVETILESHLPNAINLYNKVASNAMTAQLLNEQLASIESGLKAISTAANEDVIKQMKVHSSFLKGKFVPEQDMVLLPAKSVRQEAKPFSLFNR